MNTTFAHRIGKKSLNIDRNANTEHMCSAFMDKGKVLHKLKFQVIEACKL